MKISNITIESLNQFKNFELDLTYPKGHKKEGLPLDKICLIGQSGTGKTTLLKLFFGLTYSLSFLKKDFNIDELTNNVILRREISGLEVTSTVGYRIDKKNETEEKTLSNFWNKYTLNKEPIEFDKALKLIDAEKEKIKTQLIYFPAELNFKLDETADKKTLKNSKIIDFSKENIYAVWEIVLTAIKEYQETELILRQEISKVVELSSIDIKEITKAAKKLEKWKKTNFNPIEDIAINCLNDLLKSFSLNVKTNLDIQKKEDLGFIKLEDVNHNEVPNGLWSTGTKQIVLSVLPLYFLKPNKTIILFDEPERSLYPDMQKMLVDYYTKMTSDSQLIFATHSPIIASSFEPWEIVELKFDEKGHVHREKYFKGANHIDNYFLDPRFLNYDLILTRIFDLKSTNTELRNDAIAELNMLKNQLDKLKQDGQANTKEGKKVYAQFQALSKKLLWDI